jgi:ABC-type methionine transport system ATPase subunit
MITVKNVNKTYITPHASVAALRNINLQIAKGDIFGILALAEQENLP